MAVEQLVKQRETALNTADSILASAERQKRALTNDEQRIIDNSIAEAKRLKPLIESAKKPTESLDPAEIRQKLGIPRSSANFEHRNGGKGEPIIPKRFSRDYYEQFYSRLAGSGPVTAALYEGSSPSGGYAIPVMVDEQIVSLAPQDSAVRKLAKVIPTKSDIKTAQVTTRAAAMSKSETSAFTVAVPSLSQFTLSAFAAGVQSQASLELVEDVVLFKEFVLDDAVSAFLEYEENFFINGTGTGQAQGLINNVGAGVTEEPDSNGNLVTIQGTLDILAQLKGGYHDNASWLMSRATSLIIRKAQAQSNLFVPAFNRVNGQDYLHGYPVQYSSCMPSATRGACPILFGNFAKGYLIGDRGGSALFVKVLDQANATQGLVDILFYRRTDGRVRRSEAVQSYNVAAS